MAYTIIPTSLLNLEIVLHPKAFREREDMPEVPLGHIPQPRSYTFDGAQGLIDLSLDQWAPTIQQDEVDKNPLYSQYPYQEGDDYDNKEEEMDFDKRMLGNARDARVAASTGTRRLYCYPPASYATFIEQTLGSPHSMHTDTDAAMEFDTLQVAPWSAPPKGQLRNWPWIFLTT